MKKDWIYECLMSTMNKDKTVNIAPMGLRSPDMKGLEADIYKESQTYKNLSREKECVLNFTSVPGFFYDKDMPQELFIGMRMKYADAWLKLKVEKMNKTSNPARIIFAIEAADVPRPMGLVNRAQALCFEALIESTRVKKNPRSRQRLEHYKRVVKKVAPGSEYAELVDRL